MDGSGIDLRSVKISSKRPLRVSSLGNCWIWFAVAARLGGHTAYVTDLGMTGPHDSVIGVKTEIILRRFLTAVGQRFETADMGVQLEGVIVDVDSSGRARSIDAVRVPLD